MTFNIKVLLGMFVGLLSISALQAQTTNAENLSEIYQQALNNSPQYKANLYTMESTRAQQSVSLGKLLPNLGLATGATLIRKDQTTQSGSYRNYNVGITLTQMLFDYSSYQKYQAAKQISYSVEETYNAQKQQFILDVATAYFNVLNAKEQVHFLQAKLKAVESALEQAKLKLKVGISTSVDVKVAESNYYNVLASLKAADNNVQTTYFALYQYTGGENKNLADLQEKLHFSNPQPNDINKWIQKAQTNNPILKAQVYTQNAAQETLAASNGNFLPNVSLVANYSINDNSGSNFATGAAGVPIGNYKNGYIGVTLTWNILNGGSDYATKKQAAFNYQAAEFTTLNQKRTIKQNIETDFYTVVSTARQIQALEQSVLAAEAAYKQYQARFKVGSSTITEVLDQLQKFYESASLLASAKYKYITEVLQLKLDAGTLSEKDVQIFNSWLKS